MNVAPDTHAPRVRGQQVPERSCVACRRRRPQGELFRLRGGAGGGAGAWALVSGHGEGRSVYLCADTPACWAEKRLRRALGAAAPQVSRALLAAHGVTDAPAPARYAEGSERGSVPPRTPSTP